MPDIFLTSHVVYSVCSSVPKLQIDTAAITVQDATEREIDTSCQVKHDSPLRACQPLRTLAHKLYQTDRGFNPHGHLLADFCTPRSFDGRALCSCDSSAVMRLDAPMWLNSPRIRGPHFPNPGTVTRAQPETSLDREAPQRVIGTPANQLPRSRSRKMRVCPFQRVASSISASPSLTCRSSSLPSFSSSILLPGHDISSSCGTVRSDMRTASSLPCFMFSYRASTSELICPPVFLSATADGRANINLRPKLGMTV